MMVKWIPASVAIEEVEADGSDCIGCGDAVFLRGFRVLVRVGGKSIGKSDRLMCISCGESVKATIEKPESSDGQENVSDL